CWERRTSEGPEPERPEYRSPLPWSGRASGTGRPTVLSMAAAREEPVHSSLCTSEAGGTAFGSLKMASPWVGSTSRSSWLVSRLDAALGRSDGAATMYRIPNGASRAPPCLVLPARIWGRDWLSVP